MQKEQERERKALVIMQPSLHTVDEFNRDAIEEMFSIEPDNAEIKKLYQEYEALPDGTSGTYSWSMDTEEDSEALNEICDGMMEALVHDYLFEDDCFIIWAL